MRCPAFGYLCPMYIHYQNNKSGRTSVVVRLKSGGKVISEKSFGSAVRGTPEFKRIEDEASAYIDAMEHNVVNLFSAPPDDYWEDMPGQPSLEEVRRVLSYLQNRDIRVSGLEIVFGYIYDKIGYNAIDSELLRLLVLCRLFKPCSKLRTVDYMERYLDKTYSVRQVYYFMDKICLRRKDESSEEEPDDDASNIDDVDGGEGDAEDGREDFVKPSIPVGLSESLERITFEWTKKECNGVVTAVFYDTSTLYFESEEDDMRIPGWSKDGKHSNPQILLGLLIGPEGNPIGWKIFEGNRYEGGTLIPVLDEFAARYNLERIIVTADSGLISKKNIAELEKAGYEYILGARVKNQEEKVKQKILSKVRANGDVKVIRLDGKKRLIVSKSEAREKKDRAVAEKGLKRLEKRVQSGKLTKQNINNRGYNTYLKMEGEVQITIDREKFKQDERWYGIKGYITNTKMGNKTVIAQYHNLWYIERAFRFNKTDLRIRPIFHRLANRIEGHICISFAAYAMMVELERMIKRSHSYLSLDRIRERVKDMYEVKVVDAITGRTEYIPLGLDKDQQEIMRIIEEDRKLYLNVIDKS